MKFRHHLEYAGVRLMIALVGSLSPRSGAWLGARLGDFAFDIIRKRRRLAIRQLLDAFPDRDDIDYLARLVYRHLGTVAVEHARTLGKTTVTLADRVSYTGRENLERALEEGNGVVLVTGHFGYWELLGAAVAALGVPISVVAKDQHNPAVNRLIVRCRERLGMSVVPMASATRPILKCLKNNGCVGLLVDQDAGPGGVFVPFLGRPASTYQGPVVFAIRTGAPIVPCFIVREGPEKHRVFFEDPIHVTGSGDDAENVAIHTTKYTAVLERYIRTYPEHWFWVHRRWKTRPQSTSLQSAKEVS